MQKKILLVALLALGSAVAVADDLQYMTVAYNGIEQSIELESIRKITFENNNVVVYTAEGQLTFAQSEMERMFFSATPTAIESLPTEGEGLRMEGGVLHVSGQTGRLYVYGSNGALQHMAEVSGPASINLGGLAKGVYIVRLGSQVIKIQK